jgi:glucose dehydrogenase
MEHTNESFMRELNMNAASTARLSVVALSAIVAVGFFASPSVDSSASSNAASWPYPNGNLANTRVASGSAITTANVSRLKEVWSFKLSGKAKRNIQELGSLAMTPIVVDNVVYIQDLSDNVYALSLSSGALLWEYTVNTPEKSGPGPNGVAVANGVVYGMTTPRPLPCTPPTDTRTGSTRRS